MTFEDRERIRIFIFKGLQRAASAMRPATHRDQAERIEEAGSDFDLVSPDSVQSQKNLGFPTLSKMFDKFHGYCAEHSSSLYRLGVGAHRLFERGETAITVNNQDQGCPRHFSVLP